MCRRKLSIVSLSAMLLLSVLAGCQTARAGARCRSNGAAQDATHVLVCKKGRWVRLISKADGLRLLEAKRAAPVPSSTEAPATTEAPPAVPAPAPTTPAPTTPPPAYGIVAGYQRTCAVTSGVVKCLGYNPNGQLGDGSTTDRLGFVSTGITDGIAVASGSTASCAIRVGGTVWCWGVGNYLGRSVATDSAVPVQAEGVTGALQVDSGSSSTCAVISGGTVKCWGQYPGNGVGATGAPVTTSIASVTKVSVGASHSCALKTDGTVWCWGSNSWGQLGDGTQDLRLAPVQVSGLANVVDIAAGGFEGASCAVKSNGTVWCWGSDTYRMLGDGDLSGAHRLTPHQVVGLSDAVKVSAGFYASCAIRSGGAVRCWGSGGQLGDNTSDPSATPVDVVGVSGAVAIDSSGPHTCVLRSGNAAACWGSNAYGALGGGATTSVNYAVEVIGMP